MKEHSPKLWLFLLAMALLMPRLSAAQPQFVIPEGTDCWHTEAGTQQRLATLPAGFFGPGSKAVPTTTIALVGVPLPAAFVAAPFPQGCGCPQNVNTVITWLDPHGNPTNDARHAVKQVVSQTTTVDTCIRRTINASFPGQGAAKQVNIQLVALSLKSVRPLTVQFATGPARKFDVFVKQSGTQRTGTMTLTAGALQGGKRTGTVRLRNLHIAYDVEFREVVPAGTRPIVKRLTGQRLTLVGTRGTFTFSGVRL